MKIFERYPHSHDARKIRENIKDFPLADDDFSPMCLGGKHWELIKLDMVNFSKT